MVLLRISQMFIALREAQRNVSFSWKRLGQANFSNLFTDDERNSRVHVCQ